MNDTCFYIKLNLKTRNGFLRFGKFFIGNNKKAAADIFSKLKGNTEVDEKMMLQLDLVETKNSLPLNIQMIGCTLEELAENCRIITKEVFKLFNLEKGQEPE